MRSTSTLRIIGGEWRSRKISFIPLKGVRPTTDARRETLFNWLAPAIVGANCLDLFAGSGALGFEALSRGARHVVMVDMSIKIINQLKANAKLLQADDIEFYCLSIPNRLNKISKQIFDIVFLDPPFHHDLVKPTCEKLAITGYLAKNAYMYIESEKDLDIRTIIPNSWQILRKKVSNLVASNLLTLRAREERSEGE
ncbi:MAG: 16S rRNA (guanine(966)-N(2))-methyltransferase RsmD [Coxiellaceae bacterium]|jgi:16S rRNA (guanine966-N2)-methyltransferase|nr:16S rRNA (guanine(966)-N(2))-methyltransferase RsmD [Coxiellaceae bacterium]